jgi:hypothetical protein
MGNNLNVVWIHGSPGCAQNTDPPVQVHRFAQDTVILRQSKRSEPGSAETAGAVL